LGAEFFCLSVIQHIPLLIRLHDSCQIRAKLCERWVNHGPNEPGKLGQNRTL
jgi:hypothetical protein